MVLVVVVLMGGGPNVQAQSEDQPCTNDNLTPLLTFYECNLGLCCTDDTDGYCKRLGGSQIIYPNGVCHYLLDNNE